jgi:hypothetical protein
VAPPPPAPTPNNSDKGKGKGKNNGSSDSDNNSWGKHLGVALLQSLDRHHLDVARDAPSAAANASTVTRPACCTGVLWRPRWPSLCALVGVSTTLAADHGLYLVALDGRVGSAVIGQQLQHHGLDSPSGHRLGRRL